MGKTFEEWFNENGFSLSGDVYYDGDYFSNLEFKKALNKAWDASRNNMTYKDI